MFISKKLLICYIILHFSTICVGQNFNIETVAKWGAKDLYGSFTSYQNYGYLANDSLISILDISDARHITLISQIKTPVEAQQHLIIHNNLLFVLNGVDDAVIDVSNPKEPVLIKFGKDWIRDIKFAGSKAIVLSFYGLRIVDLDYNFGDKIIDSLNFLAFDYLQLKNNLAYVSRLYSDSIKVFDLGNFDNIKFIKGFRLINNDLVSMYINNNTLFVSSGNSGLSLFNIENPDSLILTQKINSTDAAINSVSVRDSLIFIKCINGIIKVYKYNGSTIGDLISSLQLSWSGEFFSIEDKRIYFVDPYEGLKILDYSNHKKLVEIGSYYTPNVKSFFIYDGEIYFTAHDDKLYILNYPDLNKTPITVMSGIDKSSEILYINNNVFYLKSADTLKVYNEASSDSLQLINSISLPHINDIYVGEKFIIITTDSLCNIYTLNTELNKLYSLEPDELPYYPLKSQIYGNLLAVNSPSYIYLYDISDPSDIHYLNKINLKNINQLTPSFRGVVLKNNYVYCLEEYYYLIDEWGHQNADYELLIYNITDKNNITEIYSLTTGNLNIDNLYDYNFVEYNNKLFLQHNYSDIAVYDLTLKNNLKKVGDLSFAPIDGINSLKIDSNYITISEGYKGTFGLDVYKYSYITDINNYPNENPSTFRLFQNYPNPFNPSTTIKYSIPHIENVTIKIYDVLGREAKTLVNEEKPAGVYEINWNASKLSSGVYFYQLKAGEFIQTKKMILLT